MDVKVTIHIDREALGEAVEVFKQFLESGGGVATQVQPAPAQAATAAQNALPESAQAPTPVPTGQATVTQQPFTVPTTEKTYTADELQMAAVSLVDKGMMPQLQELLVQFGVQALPQLTPDKYGAFATALRGMGAAI